ncbi:MAG TPA: HD domain-containing protein [Syntrophomonadaceae bacterium]|nr:HD domain-containing protein [Syntrophomonadaceae bacterium]
MERKGPLMVKELKAMSPGQQVFGKYLLLARLYRKTKDGKDMYNIKLGDSTGDIDGVVWENCQIIGDFQEGAVLGLLGDIGSFNGKIQVTVKRVKVLDEDPVPYLPGPAISQAKLRKGLIDYIDSIKDIYLHSLLKRIFTPEQMDSFCKSSAAKSIHHNYSGGLLEHTIEVVDLCVRALDVFPAMNRDLVVTGALLHDIGKILELDIKVVPQYTVQGRLIGHITLGVEMVSREIRELRAEGVGFPFELEWMLEHMILSHHGNLEFGSPVVPMFPEALLLHAMDNLGAKMFIFTSKREEPGGESELFTNYDSFFGQHFFKFSYKGPSEEED